MKWELHPQSIFSFFFLIIYKKIDRYWILLPWLPFVQYLPKVFNMLIDVIAKHVILRLLSTGYKTCNQQNFLVLHLFLILLLVRSQDQKFKNKPVRFWRIGCHSSSKWTETLAPSTFSWTEKKVRKDFIFQ